ncbi:MAG: hypothetical protein V4666_05380 [Bacteroidota bacterium]
MEDKLEASFEDFKSTENRNIRAINKAYEIEIDIFKRYFNIQNKLFVNHVGGLLDPYYGIEDYERILLQAFTKTNHLLYASLNLTNSGNYGASSILLRQIFEFQILGKYAYTIKDEKMSQKWLDGKQFDIYDKVIKLLDKPSKVNFHTFWLMLCKLSHATTSSHQIEFKAPKNADQIHASLIIILMLQRCNYHLLTSCFITKKLTYRSEYYLNLKKENSALKNEARLIKKEISNLLSSDGKKLIKDYESTWNFKTRTTPNNVLAQ